MSAPPFMQLYVADYLGDTRHLTTEQHGAYLLLLMSMWRAGGTLPNEAAKLARMTGCTPSRWTRIAPDVLAFFYVIDDVLVHQRLKLELEKALEKQNQHRVLGSLGGKAKALKTKKPPVADASPTAYHTQISDIRKKKEVSIAKAISPSKALMDRAELAWLRFWESYPRKVCKADARKAFLKAWRKLEPMADDTIICGALERAKAAWIEPQFIPHAATWLNGERWEDDVVVPIRPESKSEFAKWQAAHGRS